MTLPEPRAGSTRRRPPVRRTRRPPVSSVPTEVPAATARVRSTSASDGGCSPSPASRNQRRRARRASGRSARATARASAGSGRSFAASESSSATSSRSTPACRASNGTGSRPATCAHSGRSSWRMRLRTNAGSSLLSSRTGCRPRRGTQRVGLAAAQPENRVPRPRLHARQSVGPGPAQQVHQDRLRLVVHGVPGGDVGRQHGEASRPGPGLEVGARRRPTRDGSRSAHRTAPPPPAPPRPRPRRPGAGRDRRGSR